MFTLLHFYFIFYYIFFYFLLFFSLSFFFFFFSSRRRHTRLVSDWSSDVCSSDLLVVVLCQSPFRSPRESWYFTIPYAIVAATAAITTRCLFLRTRGVEPRSEERRVGKECRSRWSPYS